MNASGMTFEDLLSNQARANAKTFHLDDTLLLAEVVPASDLRTQLCSAIEKTKHFDDIEEQLRSLEADLRDELDWTNRVIKATAAYHDAARDLDFKRSQLKSSEAILSAYKLASTLTDADQKAELMSPVEIISRQLKSMKSINQLQENMNLRTTSMMGMLLTGVIDQYRVSRRRLRFIDVLIKGIWGLVLLTLVAGYLVDKIEVKWLSLGLIPIAWFFLQAKVLNPWFDRKMREKERRDLLSTASQFCFALFTARCNLIYVRAALARVFGSHKGPASAPS